MFRVKDKKFTIDRPSRLKGDTLDTISKRAKELDVAKRQGRFSRLAENPVSTVPMEAFGIVSKFIKSKGRKIYGGTAINMHLPQKHKIYSKADLPDFDFFSPTPWRDAVELSDKLYAAGLKYTEAKAGIHKGTIKVFANFWPVADITFVPKKEYENIATIKKQGYTLVSPAFLQMTLYNIISKPADVPSRWTNVALRQNLLDRWVPAKYRIKQCGGDFIQAGKKTDINVNLQKALGVASKLAEEFKMIHYGALAFNKYIQLGEGKLRLPVYFYELLIQDSEEHAKIIAGEIEKVVDNKLTLETLYLPSKDMNNKNVIIFIEIENVDYPVCIVTELTRCTPYKYFGDRYYCSIDYLKYELYTQMFHEDTDLHAYNVSCLIRYLDYIQQKYYKKMRVTETDRTPFQRFVTRCRGPYVDTLREEFHSRWVKKAEQQQLTTDVTPTRDVITLTGVSGRKIRVYPKQYVEPPECKGLVKKDCTFPCAWIEDLGRCGGIPHGGYQPGNKGPKKVLGGALVNI